jgi:hypothetical protein
MDIDFTKTIFTEDEVLYAVKNNLTNNFKLNDILLLDVKYNKEYRVIDKNHDGTKNTIDIMANRCIIIDKRSINGNIDRLPFNKYDTRLSNTINDYTSSTIREWLNTEFIDRFNNKEVKDILKVMDVEYFDGNELKVLKDKVKLLSCIEMNYLNMYIGMAGYYDRDIDESTKDHLESEGEPYPVFDRDCYGNNNSSREVYGCKRYLYREGYGYNSYTRQDYYWLRSKVLADRSPRLPSIFNHNHVWCVSNKGSGDIMIHGLETAKVVPVLRL